MSSPTLEVTFRKGRPLTAYLHLTSAQRRAGSTRKLARSVLGDFDKSGVLVGLEILAFDEGTLARINELLVSYGHPTLSAQALAPLRFA